MPELATDTEWRALMKSARKGQALHQSELASRVGASQNVISLIESGDVGSSKFILPICRVLSIAPPTHFTDEDDRNWLQLGRVLRARDMEVFRRALSLVEAMVAALPADRDPSKSDQEH